MSVEQPIRNVSPDLCLFGKERKRVENCLTLGEGGKKIRRVDRDSPSGGDARDFTAEELKSLFKTTLIRLKDMIRPNLVAEKAPKRSWHPFQRGMDIVMPTVLDLCAKMEKRNDESLFEELDRLMDGFELLIQLKELELVNEKPDDHFWFPGEAFLRARNALLNNNESVHDCFTSFNDMKRAQKYLYTSCTYVFTYGPVPLLGAPAHPWIPEISQGTGFVEDMLCNLHPVTQKRILLALGWWKLCDCGGKDGPFFPPSLLTNYCDNCGQVIKW
jgi:hypothetical protein